MPIISVLERKRRNGHFTSPIWQAPASLTGRFRVTTDILLADIVDPTKSVHLRVLISPDGVSDWSEYSGFDWIGGSRTDKFGNQAGNPAFTVDGAEVAGKFLQVVVDVPSPISVGVSLETT